MLLEGSKQRNELDSGKLRSSASPGYAQLQGAIGVEPLLQSIMLEELLHCDLPNPHRAVQPRFATPGLQCKADHSGMLEAEKLV